jgi:hypothetical protein
MSSAALFEMAFPTAESEYPYHLMLYLIRLCYSVIR